MYNGSEVKGWVNVLDIILLPFTAAKFTQVLGVTDLIIYDASDSRNNNLYF